MSTSIDNYAVWIRINDGCFHAKAKTGLWLWGCLIIGLLFFSIEAKAEAKAPWHYLGIAMPAYWIDGYNSEYLAAQLDYYRRLGFNAIELTPVWYQCNRSSWDIRPSWELKEQECNVRNSRHSVVNRNNEKTVNDDGLMRVIRLAKKHEMHVNLKPHLGVFPNGLPAFPEDKLSEIPKDNRELVLRCYEKEANSNNNIFVLRHGLPEILHNQCAEVTERYLSDFYWRAHVSPDDIDKWFASYEKFAGHYIKLGVKEGVELFTVGTELISMTPGSEIMKSEKNTPVPRGLQQKWALMIGNLRQNAGSMKLMYAAHEFEVFGTPNYWKKSLLNPGIARLLQSERQEIQKEDQSRLFEQLFEVGDSDPTDRILRVPTHCPGLTQDGNCREPSQNVLNIQREFFGLFDWISLTLYPELGYYATDFIDRHKDKYNSFSLDRDGDLPMMKENAWAWMEQIKLWAEAVRQPGQQVIIGEVGFRNTAYGHYKPFESEKPVYGIDQVSNESQSRSFEALLSVLDDPNYKGDWLSGLFVWQELVSTQRPMFTKAKDSSYSLIGKPAGLEFAKMTGVHTLPDKPDASAWGIYSKEFWDLDTGGEGKRKNHGKDEWNLWTKARFRPMVYALPEDGPVGLFDMLRVGAWLSYVWGGGYLPEYKGSYHFDRTVLGPSFKLTGHSWSLDVDLGYGWFENNSHSKGNYDGHDRDDLLYLFSHFEKDWSDRWLNGNDRVFHTTALDLEINDPIVKKASASVNGVSVGDRTLNNERYQLTVTQEIYDFNSWSDHLRLTPVALTKITHADSQQEKKFAELGAGLLLAKKDATDSGNIARITVSHGIWGDNADASVLMFYLNGSNLVDILDRTFTSR